MTKAHEVNLSPATADMLRWIAATMESEQVRVAQVWDWSNLTELKFGVEVGTKEQEFTGFTSNPLEELALAGLIEGRANGSMMTIALTPLGDAWVAYQERGKVGKWSARSALAVTGFRGIIKENAELIITVGTAVGLIYALLRWLKLIP